MTDDQMPIDFLPKPRFRRADFVLGSCNALAADWIDRWPNWPGRIRGVVIHGPADCGKSHLGEIWRQASGAVVLDRIDEGSLTAPAANATATGDATGDATNATTGDATHFLLDHPMAGANWPEDDFFHLLNRLAEGDGSVLILSRQPMARGGWQLADLSSRLGGLAAIEITPPDDAVLVAVMLKHAEDLGLVLDAAIPRYIAHRMERSFTAARQIIMAINTAALRHKKKVTLAMVRDILDESEPRLL